MECFFHFKKEFTEILIIKKGDLHNYKTNTFLINLFIILFFLVVCNNVVINFIKYYLCNLLNLCTRYDTN